MPLSHRRPTIDDAKLYFDWTNDPEVRANSHNTEPITWENHIKWFTKKINSDSLMLVFSDETGPVGQVRIDWEEWFGLISISIDKNSRGKRYATKMIMMACKVAVRTTKHSVVVAEIKGFNKASHSAFTSARFGLSSHEQIININGVKCHRYACPLRMFDWGD